MRSFMNRIKPSAAIEGSAETTNAESVEIVTINNKKFVAGLFWQPLTSPRSFMSEARGIGKKRDWDIVAIRKASRIQAGFVNKDAGVSKGMYSLAAVLAGVLGDSWIGAFDLGNGRYALVAVHEGSIVPGYDAITDKEDALNRLKQGYQLFQYKGNEIFAPADFEFTEHEKKITELLVPKNLKHEYKLKQLTFGLTKKELVAFAMLCLLGLSGAYGWTQYKAYQVEKARMEAVKREQARQAELVRLNANSRKKAGLDAVEHPWAAMPAAADFIAQCNNEINGTPLSVAGWMFDKFECATKEISIIYKRSEDTITMNDFIQTTNLAIVGFVDDGEAVMVKKPLAMKFGGDDKLRPEQEAVSDFVSHFQTMSQKVKLNEKNPAPAATAPQPGQAPAPIKNWKVFGFELESGLPPDYLFNQKLDKSGLRITAVRVLLNNNENQIKWAVTGELYVSK